MADAEILQEWINKAEEDDFQFARISLNEIKPFFLTKMPNYAIRPLSGSEASSEENWA